MGESLQEAVDALAALNREFKAEEEVLEAMFLSAFGQDSIDSQPIRWDQNDWKYLGSRLLKATYRLSDAYRATHPMLSASLCSIAWCEHGRELSAGFFWLLGTQTKRYQKSQFFRLRKLIVTAAIQFADGSANLRQVPREIDRPENYRKLVKETIDELSR